MTDTSTASRGPICTTLMAIRKHSPCEDRWQTLLKHLGKTAADDDPLPLTAVLDSNGLDDTLWCLRAVTEYDRGIRLFAVWCARQIQHLMTDQRSIAALDVAERFANGQATEDELSAAGSAAGAAALDAAGAAAWDSALDAAWDAARDSAWDSAWAAAWDAARSAQTARLRTLVETGEWDD